MKILLAYDGSACADDAINDLASAGLPERLECKVISVADVWPHMPAMYKEGSGPARQLTGRSKSIMDTARRITAEAKQQCEVLANRAAQRVKAAHGGWDVTHTCAADSPANAIIQEAGQWGADLIVVGSQGMGALGRMFFGSVSQNVIKYAPCSVRVARCERPRQPGPLRIMIGMDTSNDSAAAISAVAQRTWPRDTLVRLVTAVDVRLATALPAMDFPVGDLAAGEDPHDWLNQAQKHAAQEIQSAGLAVTTLIKEGDPKQVLLQESESWHADSIFVGAKGMTRIERFLLGSVSSTVAARAHCSVEIIRFSE